MDYIVNQASSTTTPDMSVFGVGFRFRRSFAGDLHAQDRSYTVVFTCPGKAIRPDPEGYFRSNP